MHANRVESPRTTADPATDTHAAWAILRSHQRDEHGQCRACAACYPCPQRVHAAHHIRAAARMAGILGPMHPTEAWHVWTTHLRADDTPGRCQACGQPHPCAALHEANRILAGHHVPAPGAVTTQT